MSRPIALCLVLLGVSCGEAPAVGEPLETGTIRAPPMQTSSTGSFQPPTQPLPRPEAQPVRVRAFPFGEPFGYVELELAPVDLQPAGDQPPPADEVPAGPCDE